MNKIKKIIKILIPKFILNTINNILRRIHIFLSWSPWINYSYSQREKIWFYREYLHKKSMDFILMLAHTILNVFLIPIFFYKKGWRGINIDALPGSMDLFNKVRPNDINLEGALDIKRKSLIITCLMSQL